MACSNGAAAAESALSACVPEQGSLERLPATSRYHLTELGRKLTLFVTQIYNRAFSRRMAQLDPHFPDTELNAAWNKFNARLHALLQDARLPASSCSAQTRLVRQSLLR